MAEIEHFLIRRLIPHYNPKETIVKFMGTLFCASQFSDEA